MITCLMYFAFSESDSGIFRQILRAKLDFDSDPWPQISESAKDLIKKMLDRRPQQRITAHQVLCELQMSKLCSWLISFVHLVEGHSYFQQVIHGLWTTGLLQTSL